MLVHVKVVFGTSSCVVDIACGDGQKTIKWLATVAAGRFTSRGRHAPQKKSGASAYLPSSVTTEDCSFFHPDGLIAELVRVFCVERRRTRVRVSSFLLVPARHCAMPPLPWSSDRHRPHADASLYSRLVRRTRARRDDDGRRLGRHVAHSSVLAVFSATDPELYDDQQVTVTLASKTAVDGLGHAMQSRWAQ